MHKQEKKNLMTVSCQRNCSDITFKEWHLPSLVEDRECSLHGLLSWRMHITVLIGN